MLKVVSSRLLSMIAVTTATVVMSSAQAQAFVIARNESLPSPNGSRVYPISVPDLFGDGSSVGLRLRTLSYGGGTTWESPVTPGGDPIRNGVSSGGFDPIITLFNSSGNIVSQVDDSSILGNQPDPRTGRVYDSASDLRVTPGDYRLTVTQYNNFGGGLEGIEGFTDATGSGRANRFTAQVHTISDYLSNSIRKEPEGGSMNAIFEPKIAGLFRNLSELAAFGGFDHFNWYQEVESISPQLALLAGPNQGDFDPLPGGNTVFQKADKYKWYYDEVQVDRSLVGKWKDATSNYAGVFSDSPWFPIPGSVTFTTYLVGVRGGDDGAVFANVDGSSFKNLAFKWRYDQNISYEQSATFDSWFANNNPLLGGGGDIEFLRFLQPEDWTQERIARLRGQGLTIAGLDGGSITAPNAAVPEPSSLPDAAAVPEPSSLIGLVMAGIGLLYKKKVKQ